MQARITKIGTSVGVIIPRYIATEGGFTKGTPVNIEFSDQKIVITKAKNKREGWAEAFTQYANDGEDELMLPDHIDSEAIDLMERISGSEITNQSNDPQL